MGVKTVVITGGVNDMGSDRTAEHVIGKLSQMCSLARNAGMHVVLCTIVSWDTRQYVEHDKPEFCAQNNITTALLNQRMEAVNNWIRAQGASGAVDHVVDLYNDMGRDYTKIAQAIAAGANIKTMIGGRNVS